MECSRDLGSQCPGQGQSQGTTTVQLWHCCCLLFLRLSSKVLYLVLNFLGKGTAESKMRLSQEGGAEDQDATCS